MSWDNTTSVSAQSGSSSPTKPSHVGWSVPGGDLIASPPVPPVLAPSSPPGGSDFNDRDRPPHLEQGYATRTAALPSPIASNGGGGFVSGHGAGRRESGEWSLASGRGAARGEGGSSGYEMGGGGEPSTKGFLAHGGWASSSSTTSSPTSPWSSPATSPRSSIELAREGAPEKEEKKARWMAGGNANTGGSFEQSRGGGGEGWSTAGGQEPARRHSNASGHFCPQSNGAAQPSYPSLPPPQKFDNPSSCLFPAAQHGPLRKNGDSEPAWTGLAADDSVAGQVGGWAANNGGKLEKEKPLYAFGEGGAPHPYQTHSSSDTGRPYHYTFSSEMGFSNAGPGGTGFANRGPGPAFVRPQGRSFYADITKPDFDKLPEFKKDFYFPHAKISARTDDEVDAFRLAKNITVEGSAPRPVQDWVEVGLPDYAAEYIKKQEYQEPTPIQAQAIPMALSGQDLIATADTGTGKTLAYALPALVHINAQEPTTPEDGPIALMLAPTRELAVQIYNVMADLGKSSGLRIACAYGGVDPHPQLEAMGEGVDVLIATPGRLIHFLSQEDILLKRVTYLESIELICGSIRPDRQVLMFTATWPPEVSQLASKFLSDAARVTVGSADVHAASNISQRIEICHGFLHKRSRLNRVLDEVKAEKGKILVFVNSRQAAVGLTESLRTQGLHALSLHGGKLQAERDFTLSEFRMGTCPILIATDLAQRGLDIAGITHVLNFDAPECSISEYVQRIGRCGRAGRKGHAVTFLSGGHDKPIALEIIKVLEANEQEVTDELRDYAGLPTLSTSFQFAPNSSATSEPPVAGGSGSWGTGATSTTKPAASSWGALASGGDIFPSVSVASAETSGTARPRLLLQSTSPSSSPTSPAPSSALNSSASTSAFLIPTGVEPSNQGEHTVAEPPSATKTNEEKSPSAIDDDEPDDVAYVEKLLAELDGRPSAASSSVSKDAEGEKDEDGGEKEKEGDLLKAVEGMDRAALDVASSSYDREVPQHPREQPRSEGGERGEGNALLVVGGEKGRRADD
ncbi:hypothetical protein JCM6882_007157 [Rhodosporidiobolus microsporus]